MIGHGPVHSVHGDIALSRTVKLPYGRKPRFPATHAS
jgi:hypothetical protein